MAVRPESPAEEIRRLRRCVSDLVSVFALPATWTGGTPSQILGNSLDALLHILRLDFIYARLKDSVATVPIEVLRVVDSYKMKIPPERFQGMLSNWMGADLQESLPSRRTRIGNEELSIFPVPLGFQGQIGMILVGSERKDFPGQTEGLLLSVASNQMSIGLQEARLLSEQKRVAVELDQRVGERTAELAKANDELREEIGQRKKIEERLLDSESALGKALDEIKKSEAKLRQVIDAIPTLAWCNLPDGPNEFLNKGWHEYTGLSPEGSHGWGWQAAFHPEDLPPLLKKWGELLASGESGEIEARLRRYDGVYRWFLIRVQPFLDDAGKIARWYGTSTDIEDRKRAEKERERLREAQRVVVETASDAVVSTDESGAIQFANPATMRVFGYGPEEVIGKPLTTLMPEYMRELHKNGFGRYLATGKRHINWQGTELKGLRKNGEEFAVEISFGELSRDGHKTFTGFIRDISKRKQAEQALRRSQSLLTESQRLSLTGSFSWKVGTDEIRWSEQLYRIFESERDAPITLDLIMSRIHPDDLPILNDIYDRARSGVTDLECDHRLLMPDGSVKYMHTVAHATRGQHGELEYIGASQDITRRRLSEEALSRARSELAKVARVTSLGVLTASIAHEVNQPLSGIITNAGTCLRMLSGDPPNVEGARETARRTIRDGNRASDVIARLRTLYSRKDLVPELMDLNETAREVTSLSLDELQRNRVILRHELADGLPVVAGDRIQLQQVILNLVRNASDAMSAVEDRPRQLVIRTERDEGDRVRLTVQDTGVGLDPQAADRLFDAFYTTKGDGMGIGLSVSRSIIEAHQGRLWATGNDGPGATFSFSIPCRRASQDAPESRANPTDRAGGAL